ncbi:uncharacterized protein LOC117105844 [Anneissia japonica]|uniref:uncharacterized protein LOC117105844 n=1 Tax=Anneissia japonica TaxID=1529436 RepID=UPI001425694D|nr:uncharacterized protein LOC117105844 [Anneissia japonica]
MEADMSKGISDADFRVILKSMSVWYDRHGYINKLKVLYRDLVTEPDKLYAATKVIDLFDLLRTSGHLSPADLKVLYDTINITKPFGLEPEIKRLSMTIEDIRKVIVSKFTTNRQSLIKFVESLTDNDVKKITELFSSKQKTDRWGLFVDLEHRNKICKENMDEVLRTITTHLIIDSKKDPIGLRMASNGDKHATTSKASLRTSADQSDSPIQTEMQISPGTTGITDIIFRQLLGDISEWYDRLGSISMLKVLYRDHVTTAKTLSNASTTRELLDDLTVSGNLSRTNLNILYETINLTQQFGFIPKNVNLRPLFKNVSDIEISKFAQHRQNLVRLGMILTQTDVVIIDGAYNIPQKRYQSSWHLIQDLEYRMIIREGNMNAFIKTLNERELYLAVEALAEGISDRIFLQLLEDISEWYDRLGSIRMLKVLYSGYLTDVILYNASKMRDLLDNLIASGNLSSTDLSILYETINVTEQFDFKPKNKNMQPLFKNVRKIVISKFTQYRQSLVKLGMVLTPSDVENLDNVFNMPLKKYVDSWHLIKDLEYRMIIREGNMNAFIKTLNECELYSAVDALAEGISDEMFLQLLQDISEWYDRLGSITMLKVLYRDHVTNDTTLHNAFRMRDLLENLIASGRLSRTNLSILYETINLTGQFDFEPKNTNLLPLFRNVREIEISNFTQHRQKLVKLGMTLTEVDVETLDSEYNIPLERYVDSWHLIKDLEHRMTLLEGKMESFIETLNQRELYPLVEALAEGIPKKIFLQLLQDISDWYDRLGFLSMLKVLYNDHLTDIILENANRMRDLLDNLNAFGNLSSSDLRILYETINLTEQFDFKPKNKNLHPLFNQIRQIIILKFTQHRQKLVKLGMALSQVEVDNLDNVFNMPLKKYGDKWLLIKDLEHRMIICEDKMEAFIKKLKECKQSKAVEYLADDEEIRKYLLKKQKSVCCNAIKFTPATWNTRFHVDIAHMFTDLDLLKEDEMMPNPKPTCLKEVLSIIKSTHACKVLIEGEGGIGKSTLLRYVAYNWATNESDETFKGKIVFLVNIRDIHKGESILDAMLHNINLQDFQCVTRLPQDPRLIEQFIGKHNNDIVLLLDGLDELKEGSESPLDIFKKETISMSECKVLLTSRSEKIDEFIRESNIHVKVKGFSRENIKKYITKHFEFFKKSELGNSLIEELMLNSKFNYGHQDVISICKNPMLLLSVCRMWEETQKLPADKNELFKEIFRCVLNQFIDRHESKVQKINIFDDAPVKLVNAMVRLGKCMYEGLKTNQLSINKNDLEGKRRLVNMALNLGFVYKEPPIFKSDFKEMFAAPHKLIVESLVGFYLYKLCQIDGLENECSKDMKNLLKPLNDSEWSIIRENEHLNMARSFAVGFLGPDAGKLLKHWITNSLSTYRSLMTYLRVMKEEQVVTVKETLIEHMTKTCLEIKPHIDDICKSLRSFAHHNTAEVNQNEHFLQLLRRKTFHNIDLTHLAHFCKEMSSETRGEFLAHILFAVPDQRKLLNKICEICSDDDIQCLTAVCQKLSFRYDITNFTLSGSISALFLVHLLSNAPKLGTLNCHGNYITGCILNESISECSSKGAKLELYFLSIRNSNLSNIDVSSFATLTAIAPKLNTLKMNNCSLSGILMNEMIGECCSRKFKLELKYLDICNNDLSKIDVPSFVSLMVIAPRLSNLKMSNCGLSGSIMNEVIKECCRQGFKLELDVLDISRNDLSNIDAHSFASLLFIAPKLNILDMKKCSLSGNIMDMIKECFSRGFKLKLYLLDVSGNNLSNIDATSFALLLAIAPKLDVLMMSNCGISGIIMRETIRECSRRGVKLELNVFDICGNDLSNVDICSFVSLFITAKLGCLYMSNCNLSGEIMNDIIRDGCNRGVKLELTHLDISDNDLSNIDVSTFASFFITPYNYIDMTNCRLTDVTISDVTRECSNRGADVVFKKRER